MIVVIDDEREYADSLVALIRYHGYHAVALYNTTEVLSFLKKSAKQVECIILDIMMPPGKEYSELATNKGRYTGMQLFASIRHIAPKVPVFINTIIRDRPILEWLKNQDLCQLWLKPSDSSELLAEIDKVLSKIGTRLIDRLKACKPGRKSFRIYEQICVDILKYLFVPPLLDILTQSRTLDGHEIRDAILINSDVSGFWTHVQREFDSNNIPCEFKNYNKPITAIEVHQLRIRLEKTSLGRFGLLLSRYPPGKSACIEQRNAYHATPKKLIIFLDDNLIIEMIKAKEKGTKPETVLQRIKTQFELEL